MNSQANIHEHEKLTHRGASNHTPHY